MMPMRSGLAPSPHARAGQPARHEAGRVHAQGVVPCCKHQPRAWIQVPLAFFSMERQPCACRCRRALEPGHRTLQGHMTGCGGGLASFSSHLGAAAPLEPWSVDELIALDDEDGAASALTG